MSSFIVQDETINRIVTYLYKLSYKNDILGSCINKSLKEYFDIEGYLKFENLQTLGEELLLLNLKGFYIRYSETQDIKDEIKQAIKEYKFIETPQEETTDLKVLKSLHCLTYQSCEGNNDKTPTYKFLEEVIKHLQSHIITNLEEYNKAKWG